MLMRSRSTFYRKTLFSIKTISRRPFRATKIRASDETNRSRKRTQTRWLAHSMVENKKKKKKTYTRTRNTKTATMTRDGKMERESEKIATRCKFKKHSLENTFFIFLSYAR